MILLKLISCMVCRPCSPSLMKLGRSCSALRPASVPRSSNIFFKYSEENFKLRQDQIRETRCTVCFLPFQLCICGDVRRLFAEAGTPFKAHIDLFMSFKEWGRTSNSGKLLSCGQPTKSNLYIYGVEKDHLELCDSLLQRPSLILYPGANSVPLSCYVDWYQEQEHVNLCVLDSTWNQSGTLDKVLPAQIPRVRVDDFVVGKSQFLSRKQSVVPGRVSTVEAVALALAALGEPEAALEPLYKALQLSVDATSCVRGMKGAYGHTFVDRIAPARESSVCKGMYTGRKIERPANCPLCKASSEDTVIKNLGFRRLGTDVTCLREGQLARAWLCQGCKACFFTGEEAGCNTTN
jgi:DTW domain-containing protein YfiP